MKTIRMLFFILAGFCLLMTCSKPDEFLYDDVSVNSLTDYKTVTVPFAANFITHNSLFDDAVCGPPPVYRILAEGPASEGLLGRMTFSIEFCRNFENGAYYNGVGHFVAANGDELYFVSGGKVLPADKNDPPYYLEKWNDPFTFTGGTGRFEGATGGGMTQCYNSNISCDNVSHHCWEGTLTLVKGKR